MERSACGPDTIVLENVVELLQAADLLFTSGLRCACLIVLYSSIDIMAWLFCPETEHVNSKRAFLDWVERYLLPGSRIDCSPLDVYSARCGVLHKFSAFSTLTRAGEARPVCYSWGKAERSDLEQALAEKGIEAAVVEIESLIAAVKRAVDRSFSAVSSDAEMQQLIGARGREFFGGVRQGKLREPLFPPGLPQESG